MEIPKTSGKETLGISFEYFIQKFREREEIRELMKILKTF